MDDMDWKDLEAKVATTIRLCLADDVMYHVMDEDRYMSKSLTNKLYLKQKLYGLKMVESLDLSQHINVFNQIISDLKRIDVKFEDEDKALMLLNSFRFFYSRNSGSVLMGNDASCKVFGIGNIRIKMFDGVVRTLCDVRHVPDLRKNLISLGTLDCNGFSYKSTSGVMKVSKGVMTVMKGQKLAGNIYKLLDNTVLWHMRLGHMGECGMMELHKRNLLKGIKTCKLDFYKNFKAINMACYLINSHPEQH
ncbi:hypothetical protein AAG906_006513 [Vitis piasezkii]